jgi:uncharacterized membrane protein
MHRGLNTFGFEETVRQGMSAGEPRQSQGEIDDREWSNPENWHWTFYFSRKDSRTFVPKRRGYGSTLNFGSWGAFAFLACLLLAPLLVLGAILIAKAS